ncbi:hypothetical protein Sfr7A_20925 [Streptomyces xinghaiensis]|uniref:Uncharacterized protein n=1 Tax=Streptomyces xinghaiensis TaxID=1038928 RepID=A0A3R7IR71_9ACTN|nr:hypothetical protein Sfr7A_20925 [Streptomyces xinghaiensis]RKM94413.1 hypothetical protein SFRA_018150 [Streptomyces xinghaiensis]RNC72013.1 hypothetical protein DC095_020350 [Streptomyces xinghaiensis]
MRARGPRDTPGTRSERTYRMGSGQNKSARAVGRRTGGLTRPTAFPSGGPRPGPAGPGESP